MGTIAARKFGQIIDNVENVVAMEFLSSTQALDLLKPLRPAAAVQATYDLIRRKVPFAQEDRVFATDVQVIRDIMRSGDIIETIKATVGELEW